jgi:transcriptional regulator with XRE-family HTH domain
MASSVISSWQIEEQERSIQPDLSELSFSSLQLTTLSDSPVNSLLDENRRIVRPGTTGVVYRRIDGPRLNSLKVSTSAVSPIFEYHADSQNLPKSERRKGGRPVAARTRQSIVKIKEAMAAGARTYSDLEERTGMTIKRCYRLVHQFRIQLPGDFIRKPCKDRKERDQLIAQGYSISEIANRLGVSGQAIYLYIDNHSKKREWQLANRMRKAALVSCANIMTHSIRSVFDAFAGLPIKMELNPADQWAMEQARRYRQGKNRHFFSSVTLFAVYKRFHVACASGQKLSLEELGADLSISTASVGNILKAVGLKPMYGSRKRQIIPIEKKKRYPNLAIIPMTRTDLAYFFRIPAYLLDQFFKREPILRDLHQKVITRQRQQWRPMRFSFRLASQIYEARDLGFKPREVKSLLEVPDYLYRYVVSHRRRIAAEIMQALRIMYPELDIRKPYIDYREEAGDKFR